MRYKRFKQCERNGCLYHASPNQPNGCDYCLLTGQPRGCPTGTACDKYKRVSSKRKRAIRNTLLNVGVDIDCRSGIAIPIESKRKIKIQICDDCYKSLHLIAEKRERECCEI